MGYSVGRYYDQDSGRTRWAVVGPADVWYFAKRHGKEAARMLCKRMNRLEAGAA